MFLWRRKKPATAADLLVDLAEKGGGLCDLRPGLNEDQLAELGDATATELPEDLRQFLVFTNGALLYGGACAIFGRHIGEPPYDIGDIGEATLWHRAHSSLAPQEFVFGQRSGGGVFVASSDRKTHTSRYRVWFPGEDQEEETFPSLATWLSAELLFWREVRNDSEEDD